VYAKAVEAPAPLVTVMFAAPAEPAGMTASMRESDTTSQVVALFPPNLTPVVDTVPVKFAPWIRTSPPTATPDGVADVITGTAAALYGLAMSERTPSPLNVAVTSSTSATPVLDWFHSIRARPD